MTGVPGIDEMQKMLNRVKEVFRRGSEILFLCLMALVLSDYLINRIWWNVSIPYLDTIMAYIKLMINLAILWVLALNTSVCLLSGAGGEKEKSIWQKICSMSNARLILILAGCLFGGFALRFILEKSETLYRVVLCTLLILLASGKNFSQIVRLFCVLFTGAIAVAALGLLLGYTYGGVKTGAYGTGLALGMTYPNTWARVFFLAILLNWYEWGQEKSVFWTFVLFWLAAIPTLFIVKCRTIALLMLLFPIVVWMKDLVTGRKELHSIKSHYAQGGRRVLKALMIAMPFLCFVLTLLLCSRMELLHKLTYGNYLRNMSKRFVQGGIALKEYGLPLLGKNVDLGHNISVVLNGELEDLYVLDCGYISYGLSRGIIWLVTMMAWQSFANFRCIRNKDDGMLIIGLFMSLLALMEREGFDPWYNLTLLYPLADPLAASVQAGGRVAETAG